jgi:hypothetical protein
LTTRGALAQEQHSDEIFSTIALVLLYVATLCSAQDSRVVDYYLNNPEKYEGKKMTVDCSHVERKSWAIKQDDPRIVFYAYTRSATNYKSGSILVLVSPEDAPAFANKYGFDMEIVSRRNIRTRPLSGIFSREGD